MGIITPYPPTAHVTTWTLGVQHAFTNSLSLEVSYVGNHGGQLSNLFDINQSTPGPKTTNGTSNLATLNEQNRRPFYNEFPYLSTIKIYEDAALSNYDALQMALTQRVSHGRVHFRSCTSHEAFLAFAGVPTNGGPD